MTERQFWDLIDSSRSAVQAQREAKKGKLPKHPGDDFLDRQIEWLKQKLAGMTPA